MRTDFQSGTQAANMAVYSIRDLEKLTGIKAHTIRIWEQRYQLIAPARTDTNIRYYTDENLRHLFNIALLNRQGVKISHIARMRPEEIAARASKISENGTTTNARIDALTIAVIDFDESAFDRSFSAYAAEFGFQQTMLGLIYPFLDKLNVLWLTGSISPAHEKFVSHLIRRKILAAIDAEGTNVEKEAATFLLFLPENENQELTLLFLYFLLRVRRQRVVYIGQGTSSGDFRDACQLLRPDYIFTIVNETPHRQSLQAWLDAASQVAASATLMLTGAQFFLQSVRLPANARLLDGLEDTIQFLDGL